MHGIEPKDGVYVVQWSILPFAEQEGIVKGKERRNREIAKQMLAKGMNGKLIQELTGLTAAVVDGLDVA